MKTTIYLALLMISLFRPMLAQETQDTIGRVLSLSEYLQIVSSGHPVALQADMLVDEARYKLMKARGGFDPKLFSDLSEKRYEGKDYYLLSSSGLKVPVWFGEVKAAYDINRGVQLNDQNEIPYDGQMSVGISVPLANGLWIDERRAVLKQAKIFRDVSEMDRLATLNNLYLDAQKAYWEWAWWYEQLQLFEEAEAIAIDQLEQVRQSVDGGDRRAIDTVEATIQLQSVRSQLWDAEMNYINAGFNLSTYLWYQGQVPLEVTDKVMPQTLTDMALMELSLTDSVLLQLDALADTHPELVTLRAGIQALDVERKLKVNQLLPTVNVNYNVLSREAFQFNEQDPVLGNYKWGFNLGIPLTFTKQRSELALAKLKLRQAVLKYDLKVYQQQNKVKGYLNQSQVLQQQIDLYTSAVQNYRTLLDGEIALFRNGESSLFVINSRQSKWIDARQKLLDIQVKYLKAHASLRWALGNTIVE